ncbi:YybS family protein [Bacteriovoracales bacterium]|nr:YybS family protein [Bacteriovoracales bacterium]
MPAERKGLGEFHKGKGLKAFEKLIFLGFFSILVAGVPMISQIFGAFLPIPLCMVFLIYGRRVGGVFSLALLGVLIFLHSLTQSTPAPLPLMLYGLGLSLVIGEFVKRKAHPVKAFLFGGFSLFMVLGFFLFFSETFFDFSVKGEVEKNVMSVVKHYKTGPGAEFLAQGGEGTRFIKDIIEKPKDYVEQVMGWIPSAIFTTFFLSWWANFYLILRNESVWRSSEKDYPFSLNDFLKFRVGDIFIWLLIAALGLFLGGEFLLGDFGVIIGKNLLVCLGVFYFFQGFGLLIDFLVYAKVFGMIRMLIFLSMISFGMLSGVFLAILGVLDNFKDFRKSFKKKSNDDDEGDRL